MKLHPIRLLNSVTWRADLQSALSQLFSKSGLKVRPPGFSSYFPHNATKFLGIALLSLFFFQATLAQEIEDIQDPIWLGIYVYSTTIEAPKYNDYLATIFAIETETFFINQVSEDTKLNFSVMGGAFMELKTFNRNLRSRIDFSYIGASATQYYNLTLNDNSYEVDRTYSLSLFFAMYRLQYSLPLGRIRPYAGFGIGGMVYTDYQDRNEDQHIARYGTRTIITESNKAGFSIAYQGQAGIDYFINNRYAVFVEGGMRFSEFTGSVDPRDREETFGTADISGVFVGAGLKVSVW